MKTIGIIGGSTDLATAEYYKLINARVRQELGGLHTGEVIINSMDCALSTAYVQQERWAEGAAYLHGKAQSLERAGADFILCVSNTWHRASDAWMRGLRIPLLHIADPTAAAARAAGLRVLALLGTGATMASPYLPDYFAARHGLEIVVPPAQQQRYVSDVVFNELAHGRFTDESRARYLEIIDQLARDQGAQGVILGCTEIPLLVSQADRPDFPMFDTLRLHAHAAAMKALGE